jgi:hypothetical protein
VPNSGDAAAIINAAASDLQEAQAAYDRHDLGLYQKKVEDATKKIQQAQQLLAVPAPPAVTTTTAPSTLALRVGLWRQRCGCFRWSCLRQIHRDPSFEVS